MSNIENSSQGNAAPKSNPGWKPTGGYNIGTAIKTVYCKDKQCPANKDKCPGHQEWDQNAGLYFD